MNAGEMLEHAQAISRLFERYGGDMGRTYGFSQMEFTVLMFLHNNPGRDTASDIVELRRMPKANISKAVETLIQKGYLRRVTDTKDRRRIHLVRTDAALRLSPELAGVMERFMERLFTGFTPQEKAIFVELNERIARNASEGEVRKAVGFRPAEAKTDR